MYAAQAERVSKTSSRAVLGAGGWRVDRSGMREDDNVHGRFVKAGAGRDMEPSDLHPATAPDLGRTNH